MTRANVTWDELAATPVASEGLRLAYGRESPHQFGVLRLPPGEGPHPVAAIIHGGCWEAEYDHRHVEPMAERLTAHGLATWVIEYRRLGDAGGGWPGTFHDIRAALGHVQAIVAPHGLDANRLVIVGHSAGGHLALWHAAGATRKPAGLVGLAAIADLRAYARGAGSCNQAAPLLMGGTPEEQPDRYAASSPVELAPLGVPLTLVHGTADRLVEPGQSRAMAAAERRAGGRAEVLMIEGAGHFDLVAPFADAFAPVITAVLSAVPSGGRTDM